MRAFHIFHKYRTILSLNINDLLLQIFHNDRSYIEDDDIAIKRMQEIYINSFLERDRGEYNPKGHYSYKRTYETVDRDICIICGRVDDDIRKTKIKLINGLYSKLKDHEKHEKEVKLAKDIWRDNYEKVVD